MYMTHVISPNSTPLHSFSSTAKQSSFSPALEFALDRLLCDKCTAPDQFPLLVRNYLVTPGWNLSSQVLPAHSWKLYLPVF